MSRRTIPLKLVPAGLVVDRDEIGTAGIIIHVHGASPTSVCPACGLASSSVDSRYGRNLGDLPAHGRQLKTLRGLTPYEFIVQAWTKQPERFRLDPSHHMLGSNI